jgi:hypothetical protein
MFVNGCETAVLPQLAAPPTCALQHIQGNQCVQEVDSALETGTVIEAERLCQLLGCDATGFCAVQWLLVLGSWVWRVNTEEAQVHVPPPAAAGTRSCILVNRSNFKAVVKVLEYMNARDSSRKRCGWQLLPVLPLEGCA